MMRENRNRGLFAVFCVTVLLGILGFLLFGFRKDIWFCDEVYTYEIVNRLGRPNVLAESQKWVSGYDVKMYFGAPYRNLMLKEILADFPKDNVPLYYVLLRICSVFFVGRATKWIGLAANFLFFVPFIAILFGLCYYVCQKKVQAMLFTLALAFHPLLLSQMMTIRMYCPFLFFVIASWLLVVSLKPGDKNGWWHWLLLFLVTVGGLLTHFHYWFFIGFLSLFYCISLLLGRRWRHLALYVADMAAALIAATLIFPQWIGNITQGHGGTGIANIFDISDLSQEVIYLLVSLAELLSTYLLHWAVVLCLLVLSFTAFFCRRRERGDGRGVALGVLSSVFTMAFIAHTVDERAARYFWAPAGLLFLLAVYVIYDDITWLWNRLIAKRVARENKTVAAAQTSEGTSGSLTRPGVHPGRAGVAGAALLLALDAWLICSDIRNVMYLANRPADTRQTLEGYADIPWVVYTDTTDNTLNYEMFCSFFDFTIPNRLCRIASDDVPYRDEVLAGAEGVILYINEKEQEITDAVAYLEQCRGEKSSQLSEVAQSTYCTVYLVRWET